LGFESLCANAELAINISAKTENRIEKEPALPMCNLHRGDMESSKHNVLFERVFRQPLENGSCDERIGPLL